MPDKESLVGGNKAHKAALHAPRATMESDLRLLGFVAALRAFGFATLQAFLALYLYNVLGVGYADIGVLILAYGLAPLLLSPVAGLLADRYGRRRLLLVSLAGEALGLLALAYSMAVGSLPLVSVATSGSFLLDSFGGPPNSAYVADLAEGSERTKGFTWIRIGYNAGAGAGVAVGGFLAEFFGFPAVAAFGAAFVGASSVVTAVLLHPSPYDVRLHEARRRAATGTVDSHDPAAPRPAPGRASMLESLLVLGRDRTFLEMCLAFALAGVVAGQWGTTFQLFANTKMGLDYGIVGLGVSLNCFIVVIGQTRTTHSVLGRRHTAIGVLGLLLYCVAFLGMGAATEWLVFPLAAFTAAVVVSTVGENFMSVPTTTLPSNLAPERELGNYNGAFQTIMNAAYLLSVLFGAVILSVVPSPLLEWAILVSPAVPSILLLRHVARRIPTQANRA